jgi:hypothetical protein
MKYHETRFATNFHQFSPALTNNLYKCTYYRYNHSYAETSAACSLITRTRIPRRIGRIDRYVARSRCALSTPPIPNLAAKVRKNTRGNFAHLPKL